MFPGPGGVDGGLGMAVCELDYGEISYWRSYVYKESKVVVEVLWNFDSMPSSWLIELSRVLTFGTSIARAIRSGQLPLNISDLNDDSLHCLEPDAILSFVLLSNEVLPSLSCRDKALYPRRTVERASSVIQWPKRTGHLPTAFILVSFKPTLNVSGPKWWALICRWSTEDWSRLNDTYSTTEYR